MVWKGESDIKRKREGGGGRVEGGGCGERRKSQQGAGREM